VGIPGVGGIVNVGNYEEKPERIENGGFEETSKGKKDQGKESEIWEGEN
jgi:hypothetical protein